MEYMEEIKPGKYLIYQDPKYAYLDGKHCGYKDMERQSRLGSYFVQAYQYNAETQVLFEEGYMQGEHDYVEYVQRTRRQQQIPKMDDKNW